MHQLLHQSLQNMCNFLKKWLHILQWLRKKKHILYLKQLYLSFIGPIPFDNFVLFVVLSFFMDGSHWENIKLWNRIGLGLIIHLTYKYSRHQKLMHMFLHWYHPCLNTLLCTKKFSFHTKIASKTVNINYELTLCSRCHFLNHH